MSWRWIAAIIGVTGFVGWLTRSKGSGAHAPRVKAGDRLLLIGDSLAVGLEPGSRGIAQGHGVAFDAEVKGGTRIAQWANSSQLKLTMTTFKPNVVLVSLGTNDAYYYLNQADVQPEVVKLVDVLRPARVLWIGPPMLPRNAAGVRAAILSVIPQQNYFYSDRIDIPRQPDGIHATGEGYSIWNRAIWDWLLSKYS